jgi:importin subunit alpha-1
VIETGVCRRLVDLLMHPSAAVLVPALRTVGNIVTGNDVQTQTIINCGALQCLQTLLSTHHKKSIKKEACWTISNITAGTKEQIQAVFEANLFTPLIKLLATSEYDIKKEAAWAISNATSGGSADQIKMLVELGCIKPLCDTLNVNDTRIIVVALEGLENILRVGENIKKMPGSDNINPYARLVESADGLDKIESLQDHPSEDIYEKAVHILESFYDADDGEDQNLAPAIVEGQGQYAFGAAPPAQQGFNFGGQPAMGGFPPQQGQPFFNFGPQQ